MAVAEASGHRPRVAFVAHCLLNQNAKVGDSAHCAGVYSPVVDALRANGWRIEQMPCPEIAFTGLNRFWAVREQLDTAAYRRHCTRLAAVVAEMIAARVRRGAEVVLIGVDGSPSMGTYFTSSDPARGGRPEPPEPYTDLVPGKGIFMEELCARLDRQNIVARLGSEGCDLPEHDRTKVHARLESTLARRRADDEPG
jgi:predicted secreted protein